MRVSGESLLERVYKSHNSPLFNDLFALPGVTATLDERILYLALTRRDANSLETMLNATFSSSAALSSRLAVIKMLPLLCAVAPATVSRVIVDLEMEKGYPFQAVDSGLSGQKASKALERVVFQASPETSIWLPLLVWPSLVCGARRDFRGLVEMHTLAPCHSGCRLT